MTLLHSIVLGIVQGVGEFLPISSSAHLILVPWLLGWDDGGLIFDIALHAGTLISLLVYFRKEWVEFLKAIFKITPKDLFSPNQIANPQSRIALYIIYATIPGAIMGLLLEKKAEHAFRAPTLIATTLAVMGLVLWFFDKKGKKTKSLEQMNFKDSLMIGIAQGFAVIPGFSRSGVTISTALGEGYDREASARFSFFLSMPIIAGACILKLRHLTGADLTPEFLAGIAAAAISGYFAIGGLIKMLQTRSYGAFAIYRIAVGLGIWALVLSGHAPTN
jgi:undecaprenyl-diphosphatase